MKAIDHIILCPDSTIKEALKIINDGGMRIALVTDENKKLLGTVVDGDIRRGLLKGLSLEAPIETIFSRHPTVATINDDKETMLNRAMQNKIFQIPVVDQHGVLIGMEEVDALLQPVEYPNKVILMAGGLGTRLRPLTKDVPKPMLKVGKKPILETIINNFAKHGFKNIILSVNYKAHMIEEYFGDGSAYGVSIEYVHEENRMGTAGALSFLKGTLTEPFFVMNADLLTNVNFEHFFAYHINNRAKATMAVREYDFQVPYGVVNVDEEHIVSIEEKPIHNFFVNAGIYVLDPDVLNSVPENTFFDMPTLFKALIGKKENILSFPIHEYWLDIGRLEEYEKANNEYDEIF